MTSTAPATVIKIGGSTLGAEDTSLHDVVALVRPQLERLNRELTQDLAPGHREMLPLVEHVGGFRGKQLRPVLTFLAGMAVRGAAHGGHAQVHGSKFAEVTERYFLAMLGAYDRTLQVVLKRRGATMAGPSAGS